MGVAFLCLLRAFLPSLTTLEWIDQQHFAKTKMGYISLPSNLNATIGITSYYCVILKVEILHDAIETIPNGVFVFFFKRAKTCFFWKKTNSDLKKQVGCFFLKKTGFSQPWLSFNTFVIFPWSHDLEQVTSLSVWLDVRRTLIEYRVYVPGNEEPGVTGIWTRKN